MLFTGTSTSPKRSRIRSVAARTAPSSATSTPTERAGTPGARTDSSVAAGAAISSRASAVTLAGQMLRDHPAESLSGAGPDRHPTTLASYGPIDILPILDRRDVRLRRAQMPDEFSMAGLTRHARGRSFIPEARRCPEPGERPR